MAIFCLQRYSAVVGEAELIGKCECTWRDMQDGWPFFRVISGGENGKVGTGYTKEACYQNIDRLNLILFNSEC